MQKNDKRNDDDSSAILKDIPDNKKEGGNEKQNGSFSGSIR